MKRESTTKNGDGLRQEYDLSQLQGGVRGKYYRRATKGTNVVLLDPDLVDVFPDSGVVSTRLCKRDSRVVIARRARGSDFPRGSRSD